MRARTPARALAASNLRRAVNTPLARYESTASSSSPSASTSAWQPALPRGASPAYDAALDYLTAHRDACVEKYQRLRAIPNATPSQQAEADNWEVDAYVNDPAVRASFEATKGAGQMDRPVMRHLAERRWKKRGGLDLIMGRVYQNKVVPDVIPDIAPLNPLSLSIPAGTVEPGLTIDPIVLEQPPALYYQQFQHPARPSKSKPNPSALFTLVALDPDEPDAEKHGYSQRLHYLKTNIPLSVVSGQTSIMTEAGGNELVPWEPFAPAEGSDRHRLVFILIRQLEEKSLPKGSTRIADLEIPLPREQFNFRQLLATFDLPLNAIVGVNLVKGAWTEENRDYTDRIYQQFRGAKNAPVYRDVPHGERFSTPTTALQRRIEAVRERALTRQLHERIEDELLLQRQSAELLAQEELESELMEGIEEEQLLRTPGAEEWALEEAVEAGEVNEMVEDEPSLQTPSVEEAVLEETVEAGEVKEENKKDGSSLGNGKGE